MIKLVLKWGLIGALVNIIFGLVYYILDIEPGTLATYAATAVFIAVIVFGAYEYRDKIKNGIASFTDIFKFGLMVAAIVAIVAAIWGLIYPILIEPNMFENAVLKEIAQLEDMNLTAEEFELRVQQVKNFYKPVRFFFTKLAGSLFMGALISLISAIILRKEEKQTNLEG